MEITIEIKYIEELISSKSKELVGKVMKRFEIGSDSEQIKREVKELVYEEFRDLQTNILSFYYGFKFNEKSKLLKK